MVLPMCMRFFQCSEHEYSLLLFYYNDYMFLIRAFMGQCADKSHHCFLPTCRSDVQEPTTKILCLMTKLYKKFSWSDKAFSFITCYGVRSAQLSSERQQLMQEVSVLLCLHVSPCCWYQQMSALSVVNNISQKRQMYFKFYCLFCLKKVNKYEKQKFKASHQ